MFNVTFVVQALHFFIAYIILAHYFFKPVLKKIEKDEGEAKVLEDLCSHYKDKQQECNSKVDSIWVDAKGKFSKLTVFCENLDSIEKASFDSSASNNVKISASEDITNDLSDYLVKKISSVE